MNLNEYILTDGKLVLTIKAKTYENALVYAADRFRRGDTINQIPVEKFKKLNPNYSIRWELALK